MDIISALSIQGYAELSDVETTEQALCATEILGSLILLNGQAVQELVPKEKDAAVSRSFSKRHGLRSFPLHTDTAFWAQPARFVVLFAGKSSQTATRLLPLQLTSELMAKARTSNPVFLRQTVNGPIYSPPWIDDIGCSTLYDPCCMQPANLAAKEFESNILANSTNAIRFGWTGSRALVIDNWRVLHGRDDCCDNNRVLYRFYRGIEE